MSYMITKLSGRLLQLIYLYLICKTLLKNTYSYMTISQVQEKYTDSHIQKSSWHNFPRAANFYCIVYA